MKKLLIVAMVFAAALASCQGSKNIKSFTTTDSLSYALGTDYGNHAINMDTTALNNALDVSMVMAGFRDVMAKKGQMTQEEAFAFLNEWFSVRIPAQNALENQEWLDKVKADNKNIQELPSGLLYEIVNEGDASVKAIDDADQVMVNYKGTLKNGNVFDQNDSISFPLNRVIPAWTEGMKLVGKGGDIILWVPAHLGYGDRPAGSIPANSALKFEVKLLDVIPAEETSVQ